MSEHGSYSRGRSGASGQNQRRDQGQNPQSEKSDSTLDKAVLERILDGDAKALVDRAEPIARDQLLGDPRNKVTTSQIRNIFGAVKRLEMNSDDPTVFQQLILMKPRLAYVAGRHKIRGLDSLRDILSQAIDLVGESKTRFLNFCRFFEAILAYHKAHGGK